jgi:hypothetical protein
MVPRAAADALMNAVYNAALEVQSLFEQQGWQFCTIGGLAVIRWGRMRTTQDADFSLMTGFGDEDRFLTVIADHLEGREPNEVDSARASRVYRGFASNGIEIDIALAALPFEQEVISRASVYEFRPGCVLSTCSADDLIVMKAFASRDQDWADVRNVAASQWKSLDWDYIHRHLEQICELSETFTSVPLLDQLRAELEQIMKRPKRNRS